MKKAARASSASGGRGLMIINIKNKIVSLRGSSDITDTEGNKVFTVKGKVFSFRRKKFLYDKDGRLLFRIQNKFINWFVHRAFIFDGEGNKVCSVKDKWFNVNNEYFVYDCKDEIKIDGKFMSRDSRIVRNGEVVAFLHRNFDILRDSFQLEAQPSDLPFLAALVIALDNIVDNRQNG